MSIPTKKKGRDWLQFQVRDTGIGIPAEKLEAVFESFNQADSSTTREYGGTGLGLAICRRLVEMMGGSIRAESTVGKGTAFIFTIPMMPGPVQKKIQPASLASLNGLRVLIVDDNATNRLIFSEHLSRWGTEVVEAENGWQALARLAEAEKKGKPFQLALLDYNMPGMDGIDLARRLREEKYSLPPSLMMFSSSDTGDQKDEARELGISRYFVKPIKQREMIQAVLEAIGRSDSQVTGGEKSAQAVAETLPEMNILLVEDYQPNRKIVESFLKKTPVRITTAENGQEAVDRFLEDKFDVVLMDMEMPIMDGLEATRRIRKYEGKKQSFTHPYHCANRPRIYRTQNGLHGSGMFGFHSQTGQKNAA